MTFTGIGSVYAVSKNPVKEADISEVAKNIMFQEVDKGNLFSVNQRIYLSKEILSPYLQKEEKEVLEKTSYENRFYPLSEIMTKTSLMLYNSKMKPFTLSDLEKVYAGEPAFLISKNKKEELAKMEESIRRFQQDGKNPFRKEKGKILVWIEFLLFTGLLSLLLVEISDHKKRAEKRKPVRQFS